MEPQARAGSCNRIIPPVEKGRKKHEKNGKSGKRVE
jgi:hypothetical protein